MKSLIWRSESLTCRVADSFLLRYASLVTTECESSEDRGCQFRKNTEPVRKGGGKIHLSESVPGLIPEL